MKPCWAGCKILWRHSKANTAEQNNELEFGTVPNETRQLVSTYSLVKKKSLKRQGGGARAHVPTIAGDATA